MNLNSAYHRKFMVVDGRQSWIGSLNIGDEYQYYEDLIPFDESNVGGKIPKGEEQWHDGMFHIHGESVAQWLNILFASQVRIPIDR